MLPQHLPKSPQGPPRYFAFASTARTADCLDRMLIVFLFRLQGGIIYHMSGGFFQDNFFVGFFQTQHPKAAAL